MSADTDPQLPPVQGRLRLKRAGLRSGALERSDGLPRSLPWQLRRHSTVALVNTFELCQARIRSIGFKADDAGIERLSKQPEVRPTPLAALALDELPTELHFVRSHFAVPTHRAPSWHLELGGAVDHRRSWSLVELQRRPSQSQTVVLECAGHRRSEFQPATAGLQWGVGAISEAPWTGVPLAELPAEASPSGQGRSRCSTTAPSSGGRPARSITRSTWRTAPPPSWDRSPTPLWRTRPAAARRGCSPAATPDHLRRTVLLPRTARRRRRRPHRRRPPRRYEQHCRTGDRAPLTPIEGPGPLETRPRPCGVDWAGVTLSGHCVLLPRFPRWTRCRSSSR